MPVFTSADPHQHPLALLVFLAHFRYPADGEANHQASYITSKDDIAATPQHSYVQCPLAGKIQRLVQLIDTGSGAEIFRPGGQRQGIEALQGNLRHKIHHQS